MAKKIKGLTDVMVDYQHEEDEADDLGEKLKAHLQAGNVAMENGYYEQAWDHFYTVYSSKDTKATYYNYYRGEGAYSLCKLMQEIPNDDELITKLIETDTDLVRKSKQKHVSNEFARKYLGRIYLVFAADTCGSLAAMAEYALNCVGSGHKKSFVFDYNDRDAQVGLQWANKLISSNDSDYKAIGYMVHAKYHFARYTKTKSTEECKLFCDNVISAKNLVGETNNEYTLYFFAHMCANPNFKDYNNGYYYNPKKGYELYCKVIETATDPDLVASATNIKAMLETKYSTKIK